MMTIGDEVTEVVQSALCMIEDQKRSWCGSSSQHHLVVSKAI